MSSIVIAEKPDQGRLYEGAVGSLYGRVFAARGHLFELAEPEDVNPAWKVWSVGIMRPDSGFYPNRLKGDADLKRRYNAIRDAARNADTIYVATDPDREGEGIGTDIVKALRRDINWSGRVLRVLPLAQDKGSLQKAFANAEPGESFNSLYQSYVARQQSDQIFNLSLTRSVSELFKPAGWKGALSVGRVLTPTLGIVCKREREIASFVPQDYFNPWVEVAGQAGKVRLTHAPGEANRILDRAAAQGIVDSARGYDGLITVRRQRTKQAPPPLFSLGKLQAEASRRFKWSVAKTTDILQKIYDASAVTYPRSSETSLPESEIENAPSMLAGILRLPGMDRVTWGVAGPVIRVKAGAFSDKDLKGAAHFAIIPNINTVDDWGRLHAKMSADEKSLFDLIARRYLAAIGPDRVYDSTRQSINVRDREFWANGTVEVVAGWREAAGQAKPQPGEDGEDDDDAGALPAFDDGDAVTASGVGIADKQTTPPPRYTDATLVIAMIEAWRHVQDADLRAVLKETEGIGTEATRSRIVANLMKKGFLVPAEKSAGSLKASDAAMEYFAILEAAAPRLLDVGLTGHMEVLLERIKSGDTKAVAVVNEIVGVAETAVASMVTAKEAGAVIRSTQEYPPSEGMKKAARAKAKREGGRVPAGVLTDMAKCRAYLGPLPDREQGEVPRAPSEKALAFARQISMEISQSIPEDALTDSAALSKWIDSHRGGQGASAGSGSGPAKRSSSVDNDRPSSRQVGFAEKVATRKRIEVPPECYKSKSRMSQWLDANTK